MLYQYVFFDLDGTLTDPGVGITNSVMYALRHYGITVADRSELYPFIGPPLIDSFQKYYGFSKAQAQEATEKYREYFSPKGLYENEVYPGIPELLQRLRDAGLKLLVATSKPEPFALRILEHFDLTEYFDCIAGAAFDETRTQKWEVIDYALERLGVADRSRVVMVGDRENDVQGARHCSLGGCIGVLYGYGSREELRSAGADVLAETPAQIADIILNSYTE